VGVREIKNGTLKLLRLTSATGVGPKSVAQKNECEEMMMEG
jgi:hypothetical protein